MLTVYRVICRNVSGFINCEYTNTHSTARLSNGYVDNGTEIKVCQLFTSNMYLLVSLRERVFGRVYFYVCPVDS